MAEDLPSTTGRAPVDKAMASVGPCTHAGGSQGGADILTSLSFISQSPMFYLPAQPSRAGSDLP